MPLFAMGTGAPVDWYRTSFASNFEALYWDEGAEEKVALALEMLKPDGHERILDLACATGRRTLELCRRGFDVVGVDIREELLSPAGETALMDELWPHFVEEDPRYLEFEREFDLVLSLGGGAFEHFDSCRRPGPGAWRRSHYDEENLRAFEAAARALRPGGRLLMETPNVLHVEAHLPERTWFGGGNAVDLVEQHWNGPARRIDGTRRSIVEFEQAEDAETVPFQRRLYTVEELAQIFESVGMRVANVFDEHGAPCAPTDAQQEIYVEAQA